MFISRKLVYTLLYTYGAQIEDAKVVGVWLWCTNDFTEFWQHCDWREIECWTERDEVGYEWCVYVLVRSCCFALIRNQYQKVTLTIMGCYDGRSRVRCSWLIYLAWVHTFGINLLVSGKIVVDRCVLVRESWQLLSFCLRLGKRENLCEKLNPQFGCANYGSIFVIVCFLYLTVLRFVTFLLFTLRQSAVL